MMLDERKKAILRAIIDDYIKSAEPVGSRTIAKRHELGLSSATIRNEMADLEEYGYLVQPHTSAGRIPSDKGYRLYVDELMRLRALTSEEIRCIKEAMEIKINELGQLIRQASSIMSRITRYTSVAVTPKIKEIRIKAVQVVPIDSTKVLVIVVASTGIVRNSMVHTSEAVSTDSAAKLSNMLNEKVGGLTAEEIDNIVIFEEDAEVDGKTLVAVLEGVNDCINQIRSLEVYLEGMTNIFDFPEFRDNLKAREFLSLLDAKDMVYRLLSSCSEEDGIKISIGTENEIEEMKEYSLITATYSVADMVLGTIGVIGPTRMEYPRVVSSLNYLRRRINDDLRKLLADEDND
jgi:heat-inducible transcriptional repressor